MKILNWGTSIFNTFSKPNTVKNLFGVALVLFGWLFLAASIAFSAIILFLAFGQGKTSEGPAAIIIASIACLAAFIILLIHIHRSNEIKKMNANNYLVFRHSVQLVLLFGETFAVLIAASGLASTLLYFANDGNLPSIIREAANFGFEPRSKAVFISIIWMFLFLLFTRFVADLMRIILNVSDKYLGIPVQNEEIEVSVAEIVHEEVKPKSEKEEKEEKAPAKEVRQIEAAAVAPEVKPTPKEEKKPEAPKPEPKKEVVVEIPKPESKASRELEKLEKLKSIGAISEKEFESLKSLIS